MVESVEFPGGAVDDALLLFWKDDKSVELESFDGEMFIFHDDVDVLKKTKNGKITGQIVVRRLDDDELFAAEYATTREDRHDYLPSEDNELTFYAVTDIISDDQTVYITERDD